MNNPAVISFLIEWVKRYGQKSPKFFKVLTILGTICALIGGVPQLLTWLHDVAGWQWVPPVAFNKALEDALLWSGIVGAIVAGATVQDSAVTVTSPVSDNKTVVVKSQLPFTAQAETKKAEADPSTTVITSNDPPKPVA